jgi:hypothetical protein
MLNTPFQVLLVMLAGWVNEQHRAVNAYLKEENRPPPYTSLSMLAGPTSPALLSPRIRGRSHSSPLSDPQLCGPSEPLGWRTVRRSNPTQSDEAKPQ